MTHIVVIGSGIGGLCAATHLASHKDIEVTVIEQSQAVGGRLQTIEVDGFSFDIGATLLTPHFIKFLDKKYGLNIDVLDIYWDTIAFESREHLRIDDSLTALEDIKRITGEKFVIADLLWNAILFLKDLGDFRTSTINEFLQEIQVNEKLQVFLQSGAIDAGLPSDEASAYVLKLMEYAHDFKYPRGGTGKISVAMAELFQQRGGKIELQTSVTSINDTGEKVIVAIEQQGQKSQIEADYVISAVGVKRSLGLIQNSNSMLQQERAKLKRVKPTIATTHLMFTYNGDAKSNYIARSPLNNYYPYDTVKEINDHMHAVIEQHDNTPFGFYCHFPALYDHSQVKENAWPVSFWLVTTADPTAEEIEKMKKYCIDQFDTYFLPGFRENHTYLGTDKPVSFVKNYGDPGTTSNIAPVVNYPTFESKMTDRIYLAGSGVLSDLASSVIQASQSGYDVAIMLEKQALGGHEGWVRRLLRKIFGR